MNEAITARPTDLHYSEAPEHDLPDQREETGLRPGGVATTRTASHRSHHLAATRDLDAAEYAGLSSPLGIHAFARDYPMLPATARAGRPHELTLESLGKSIMGRGLDN